MATGTIKQVTNNSTSNYCKMPDGTLIQWGSVTVAADSYVVTAYFSVPFTNANYAACVQAKETGTAWNVGDVRSDRMRIGRTPSTAANNYYYIAIGRWKN